METLQERMAEVFPQPQARGLQAEIAALCKVKPSSVSAWFNLPKKVSSISRSNAETLCSHFKLSVSPAWLAEGEGYKTPQDFKPNQPKDLTDKTPVAISSAPNAIQVPLLENAGAMGEGCAMLDGDVIAGQLTLNPSWVSSTLHPSRQDALRFIHSYGDSMTPTFNSGDVLLVDTGINEVKIDGVYVLNAHDRLFIKRVRQRLDGVFEISSDNPTHKTVDVLNGTHTVLVLGRVIWVWNGRRT